MPRLITSFAVAGGLALGMGPTLSVATGAQSAAQLRAKHEGDCRAPTVSPDGREVAYEVWLPRGVSQVWRAPVGGGPAPSRVQPEAMDRDLLLRSPSGTESMFSWSPAASPRTFAYVRWDAEGDYAITIDNWSGLIGEGSNAQPVWSPTAARFAFASSRTGGGDLYLWDDGAELRLTFDETHAEVDPAWSPEGERLAFRRTSPEGSGVFVLDVALFASTPLPTPTDRRARQPSWSPNGETIAYFARSASGEGGVDAGAATVTDADAGAAPDAGAGPDADAAWEIWVISSAERKEPKCIATGVRLPARGGPPWLPDGSGVLSALWDADAGDPLVVVPAMGGAPLPIPTGTRGNRDPVSFLDAEGRVAVAFVGRNADEASPLRLFTAPLPPSP